MPNSPEYKKAAIDWVLANGESNGMGHHTTGALADLTVRGVDYEASDTPGFQMVHTDHGDSFNEGTLARAFACTVYPLGRDRNDWRDCYTFHIGAEEIQELLVSQMILGVLAAAETGDATWKARADQREIERMLRNQEADRLREQALAEALAAKAAEAAEAAEKASRK